MFHIYGIMYTVKFGLSCCYELHLNMADSHNTSSNYINFKRKRERYLIELYIAIVCLVLESVIRIWHFCNWWCWGEGYWHR